MGKRLDIELVDRELAKTRTKAQNMIKSSCVGVNNKIVTKPAFIVEQNDEIQIVGETLKYVGKGGLKLEKAISEFDIDLNGKVCVDFGASTGGFTDCMLQNGACCVYAVDVGRDQLDKSLLNNSKVINIENTNIKTVTKSMFEKDIDFCSVDLSFISLSFAIPVVYDVLSDDGEAVLLIKPQFEAGPKNLSKKGIVKDKKIHIMVLENITALIKNSGLSVLNLSFSPIKGGDGNIEYLVHVTKRKEKSKFFADIKNVVEKGFESLKK